jgi:phospho-N-acetylmuramoyl-pentapeptide-transferase
MGGLAFVTAIGVSLLLSILFLFGAEKKEEAISLLLCLSYALLNSLIGIFDDLKKLKRKKNLGLTPKQKLLFQTLLASLFLTSRAILLDEGGGVSFSFGEFRLGALYYPVMLIMLLGIVNCANLTDGVDGLASSVAFSVGVVLFYVSPSLSQSTSFIAASVMGASVGFLFFNLHPARIFMGDTGSLFFGAILISAFFSLENPLLAILVCAVYVIEGLSVIIQVSAFKLTGKRVFRMAPIHHHLEKCGMSENKICIIAMILTFIASIPAFILYLP